MPKQTDKELELFFKNARHEQKLTYEELAEKAEMSSRYLKEIENGGLACGLIVFRRQVIIRSAQSYLHVFRSFGYRRVCVESFAYHARCRGDGVYGYSFRNGDRGILARGDGKSIVVLFQQ